MRKLTFAFAVAAAMGAAALAGPASAAPGLPAGVTAPDAVTHVQMSPMERRMERRAMRRHMERRMERRAMRRHMERRMMRRHMMRNM